MLWLNVLFFLCMVCDAAVTKPNVIIIVADDLVSHHIIRPTYLSRSYNELSPSHTTAEKAKGAVHAFYNSSSQLRNFFQQFNIIRTMDMDSSFYNNFFRKNLCSFSCSVELPLCLLIPLILMRN